MCGIVAFQGQADPSLVRDMMARIQHRGLDGNGFARVGRTTLGHVRLAVLDLVGGSRLKQELAALVGRTLDPFTAIQ